MELGLGLGLGGVVLVVVLGFILNYRLVQAADKNDEARRVAEVESKAEREANVVLIQNEAILKTEVTDLRATNVIVVAQLAATKKVADDLLHAIEASPTPGALPLALHAQLDRLRAQVSAATKAATPGNPPGGETGPVHEGPAVKPP